MGAVEFNVSILDFYFLIVERNKEVSWFGCDVGYLKNGLTC